ncbi:MAG: hypothetical protein WA047_03185 [Phenylobacterium sp.]|uniref:hypothetical protein n=1 Tax=Phenylobacterium sp. TaxID=1871053 RepID=UPI003BB73F00
MIDTLSGEDLAAIASAILALLALMGGALRWRAETLRRDDVHSWADRAIQALQSLVLLTSLRTDQIPAEAARERLTEIVFATSVLTEQGRLFFRNQPAGRFGQEKPRAYRGRRPQILDKLIAAHHVALRLPKASAAEQAELALVAEDALKEFVSLIQQEVGRHRSAHPGPGRPGDGTEVDLLISRLDPARVAARRAGR